MNADRIQQDIDRWWDDSIVSALSDYIRIPNKSPQFDPQWESAGHMMRAAELMADWCRRQPIAGLKVEIVSLPGRTPLLLVEIPASPSASGGEGCVLLYGHLDKQPEFTGWSEGLSPWTPVIRDGKLYGRGGGDDGYAVFASLAAIRALHEQGIPHARCVVLIEACEESGSVDLPYYVDALAGRIGTVDRFQGQEAPVVVYSMTSSSPEDAPRGMEFLYNRNRFNVATSRALGLCVLVGSPALFEPECKTPQQMKMANGFCRYLELAI